MAMVTGNLNAISACNWDGERRHGRQYRRERSSTVLVCGHPDGPPMHWQAEPVRVSELGPVASKDGRQYGSSELPPA
jgi:hypothetical protein